MADEETEIQDSITPETAEDAAPATATEDDAPGIEAQSGDDTQAEEPSEEKPKKRSGFQKRISGLTARLAEQQAQLDRLQAERAAPEVQPPNQDDYPDYEQYLEARAEYAAERKFQSLSTEAEARHAHNERVAQQRIVETSWSETLDASRELHEDFDEIRGPLVALSECKNRCQAERGPLG